MTPSPPFADSTLRAVLRGAVAAWARQAAQTAAGDDDAPPRLVYVDAFAGADLQFGIGVARAGDEELRAVAALRALDAAVADAEPAPAVNAILAEEDPAHLQRLYGALEMELSGERLRATADFASLAPGEVTLVETEFARVGDAALRFAAGARSFFWLAPPAARLLPWEVLRPIVSRGDADLLIRFPHADFEKQARHTSPVADLPGFARRLVEGCSALLGDAKHAWLPAWRAAPSADAMAGVLARFQSLLEDAAGDRIVKPIALRAQDGGAAWLFLVTASPEVASALDAAISPEPAQPARADADQPPPPRARGKRRAADDPPPAPPAEATDSPATRPASTAAEADAPPPAPPPPPVITERPAAAAEVLDLFPEDVADAWRPDATALAETVAAAHAGRTVTWSELLRASAATGATPDELKRALAVLKRAGRAAYRALKDDAEIAFPAVPEPPAARPKRRRETGDGGLFGGGDAGGDEPG